MANILSGRSLIIIVAIIMMVGFVIFFSYDIWNNGPVFLDNDEPTAKNKHGRKNNKIDKKELAMILIPLILVFGIFTVKSIVSRVDSPATITNDSKRVLATRGRVVDIDRKDGAVLIATNAQKRQRPLLAKLNGRLVLPYSPKPVFMYDGLSLNRNTLLDLQVGDPVNVWVHPFKMKYKNYSNFPETKNAKDEVNFLNKAKVNGEVSKR
ncbi:hypothetical protein M3M35_05320 [Fructilactobacillus myrtifloralis]|uniref:Uncharacterized protein n=1 Tax=Fructilactobacillus myrtifloralis TaxID=2940301 RepID=A0ABY5BNR1_9LACO|nr:hypothetical protein [Fructilactobacillus myrtifloralis]USS84728.1 hypothetical protein M3M35_05320 [Fructilactobacillus myrtifloralis]